jgi:hypothetical protein
MSDDVDQLAEFKSDLRKAMDKSQESFEKQLSFISAGALGLSMVFIEKIVRDVMHSLCRPLLIMSWLFLAATFILNLISHIVAIKLHYKTIADINLKKYDQEKASSRVNTISWMNLVSVLFLLVGVALLIIFVTINV